MAGRDEPFPSGDFALTVAVDAGAEWFRIYDITPTLAVGDFDSISTDTLVWLKNAGVTLVQASSDKDVSDLNLALQECEQRDITSALILGAMGGRLDHQLAVLGALTISTIPELRLASLEQSVQLLRAGQTAAITESGTTFSVITPETATVSVADARWPLDHAELNALSSHGLSNESSSNVTRITVHTGTALLIIGTG
jgi:thiamine pyrophosphokinase